MIVSLIEIEYRHVEYVQFDCDLPLARDENVYPFGNLTNICWFWCSFVLTTQMYKLFFDKTNLLILFFINIFPRHKNDQQMTFETLLMERKKFRILEVIYLDDKRKWPMPRNIRVVNDFSKYNLVSW